MIPSSKNKQRFTVKGPDKDKLIPSNAKSPVWICVGKLIDGDGERPIRDAHLVYDGHEIRFVGQAGAPPPAGVLREGQREPDARLPEWTALPGLIEAHAHFFLEGAELNFDRRRDYLQLNSATLLERAQSRLRILIELGIMAVRDAGDKDGVGLALSRQYRRGKGLQPLMPYVDSPGAALHHRGRYGSFMGRPVEDHATLEDCVKARIREGADRIKLIPTGIINFAKGRVTARPQMPAEEVRALVQASRELDRQTFAHASGSRGIGNAIAGSVDSVEHGFFVTEEQLGQMRDRSIAWVPTFAPVQKQLDHSDAMGWNAQVCENLRRILDGHAASLQLARRLGVTVIAGSDAGSCGVAHGLGFLYELELMERAGLPPIAVINAATGSSVSRLGFHERIGRLAEGYKARFILTPHDPLASVANLKLSKWCLFDGLLLEAPGNVDESGL